MPASRRLQNWIKLALVVLTPIAFYLGWRARTGAVQEAAVWAEVAPSSDVYRPRTVLFDGARRHVTLAAARGEAIGFVVRIRAERPLRRVGLAAGALRDRAGEESAARLSVWREGEGGALLPPEPFVLEPQRTGTWRVLLEVPREVKPGRFLATLTVESEEGRVERLLTMVMIAPTVLPEPLVPVVVRTPPAGAAERALLAGAGATLGAAPPCARCAADRGALRLSAWRAARERTPLLDVGPAEGFYATTPAGPAPTLLLWELRRAVDDLRYLGALRRRGDALVERILARVTTLPPADAEKWEEQRQELAGLLGAPGDPSLR